MLSQKFPRNPIKGEKDGRMLMSVGLNAEVRDNIRFGL
ncbi:peptidase S6, IgA endopeptidase from phage origin, partial [Escherichia coli O103:H25 str. CVM9340]